MGWDHTPNTATTTRAPVVLIKDTRHNINTGMFLASLSLAELLLLLVYIPLEVFLFMSGLHKLWYPGIWDMSTWSKFGAHGEHGDVFLFSNLGAL